MLAVTPTARKRGKVKKRYLNWIVSRKQKAKPITPESVMQFINLLPETLRYGPKLLIVKDLAKETINLQ